MEGLQVGLPANFFGAKWCTLALTSVEMSLLDPPNVL